MGKYNNNFISMSSSNEVKADAAPRPSIPKSQGSGPKVPAAMATNKIPTFNGGNEVYYHNLASSLSKRPIGIIAEEEKRKIGKKNNLKPSSKKAFANVVSKLNTGVKKSAVKQVRQSNDLTAKKKEELYGRVSTE